MREMRKDSYHEVASFDVVPTEFKARVSQVIQTNLERKGAGTEKDPVRRITQYWTTDGHLLAEVDPCAKEA